MEMKQFTGMAVNGPRLCGLEIKWKQTHWRWCS